MNYLARPDLCKQEGFCDEANPANTIRFCHAYKFYSEIRDNTICIKFVFLKIHLKITYKNVFNFVVFAILIFYEPQKPIYLSPCFYSLLIFF